MGPEMAAVVLFKNLHCPLVHEDEISGNLQAEGVAVEGTVIFTVIARILYAFLLPLR